MKKILAFPFFLLTFLSSNAQQDPLFSQYMFNAMIINPAATGHRETLIFTGSSRTQWVGMDGAPQTFTFTTQTPLTRSAGLGLLVMNDRIGQRQVNNAQISAAYRFKIGPGRISFGLRAGGYRTQNNWQNLNPRDQDDNALQFENQNHTGLNADAGLFYSTENFYSGIAVNHLVNTDSDPGVTYLQKHVFITTGHAFNLSEKVVFQPSFLLKLVENAPVNGDINFNFRFADVLWTGVSLRTSRTAVMIAAFDLSEKLRIGYSYDLNFSKVRTQLPGTHELYLALTFNVLKGKTINPRYL